MTCADSLMPASSMRSFSNRPLSEYRGLVTCWCGYDMSDHNIDAIEYGDGANAPIQDHAFRSAGGKRVSWLLELAGRSTHVGVPFDHDHSDLSNDPHNPPVESFCLLCRIERAEAIGVPEPGQRSGK